MRGFSYVFSEIIYLYPGKDFHSSYFLNTYGSLYAIDNKSMQIIWFINLNQSNDLNTRRGGMESGGGPGGTEGTGSTDDLAIIKFRVKLFSVENDDPIWAETVSTRGRGGLHKSGLRNHAYMIAKASFKSLKKSGHLKK